MPASARRDLLGRVPGKEFVDTHDPYSGTKVGVIRRVDSINMKADIKILTGGTDRFEVDLTQAMAGPRSFFGGVPEVGSVVLIAYRRKHKNLYDAVILGYIPVGLSTGMRFDPFSGINPNEIDPADKETATQFFGAPKRYKRMMLRPGDVGGMSSAGAEFALSRDVRFVNRAGDLIELRDVDRTLVSQAVHHVAADGGSYFFSGPIRRGQMNLPRDLFTVDAKTGQRTRTIKSTKDGYYGRDELSSLGPPGSKFINPAGQVLDRINDDTEFPTITYSNGREVYYASATPAQSITTLGADDQVFVERRLEMHHTSNLQPPVLEEIDGFTTNPSAPYIELVYGTTVGNDAFGSEGQRQYARVLKPKIFDSFDGQGIQDAFRLDECIRAPGTGNGDEAQTMAGAFMMRMTPPDGATLSKFVAAISKQGKLFVNVPGSRVENYDAKNVSVEFNAEGAIKAHFGKASPTGISLHLVCDGGVHLDIGADDQGNSLTKTYRGAVKDKFNSTNNVDDVAYTMEVQGNSEKAISGNYSKSVQGAVDQKVSGGYSLQASNVALHGLNGYSGQFGSKNVTVTGKTQYNYAQLVQETIALGGRLTTILAGGEVETILAGAKSTTVAAGATVFNNPAGAFSITVGTGAIGITTVAGAVTLSTGAGALALTAAGGAVAITAGLACNITAPTVSILSPQILLGGPPAVLGISRGLPIMPPGTPSLCYITGLPVMGSMMNRST